MTRFEEKSSFWYEAWWAESGLGPKICIYRHRLCRTWSWRGFFERLDHVIEGKHMPKEEAERQAREWARNLEPPEPKSRKRDEIRQLLDLFEVEVRQDQNRWLVRDPVPQRPPSPYTLTREKILASVEELVRKREEEPIL